MVFIYIYQPTNDYIYLKGVKATVSACKHNYNEGSSLAFYSGLKKKRYWKWKKNMLHGPSDWVLLGPNEFSVSIELFELINSLFPFFRSVLQF